MITIWNQHTTPPIPKVDPARLSAKRREAILAALKIEADLGRWRELVIYLERQTWTKRPGYYPKGHAKQGQRIENYTGAHADWVASIDWICKPGQLQKVLEKMRADIAAGLYRSGAERPAATGGGKYAAVGRADGTDQGNH